MILFSNKRKLNNKGNTLSIVIIGIFVLAILGTLILNVTATNLRIRSSEYKAEKQFYYAEKAIDQIYAGIGTEAMNSVRKSYNDVLKNYVKSSGTNKFTTLNNADANDLFNKKYMDELKNSTTGYPLGNSESVIGSIKSRFQGYISDITDCTCDLDMANTSVVYDDNTNTKKITIKNVKIVTTHNGYSSSITTDFVIIPPKVNINFIDSSSKDFTYLFKNALVVNGDSNVSTPALRVNSNVNFNVEGNCYFGSNAQGSYKAFAKDSVKLESLSSFNYKSLDNFVCKGSLVLNGATATIDTKKVWARNLVTQGLNDKLTIKGDCIIPDDLEVNGTNSVINISNGSYYGCGYVGSSEDYNKEANSGDSTKYFSDENAFSGNYIFDHEKRSAIMVNGVGADIDLSNLSNLILGGRAFIDLDNVGNEAYATYMTGESVSLKGNQKTYLADTSKLGEITANPCDYNQITKYINNGELNYDEAKIDKSSILAKKVGNDIFFYDKVLNPVDQTNNFKNKYSNAKVQKTIKDSVTTLKVKKLLLPENRFTVGAVSEVKDDSTYKMYDAGSYGTESIDFYKLMPDLKSRTEFMTNQLKEFTDIPIGTDYIPQTQTAKNTDPLTEFINLNNMQAIYGSNKEFQNIQNTTDSNIFDPNFKQGLIDLLDHYNIQGVMNRNVGIQLYDNASNPADVKTLADGSRTGIIIVTGNCKISNDFTGLIICGGNLEVQGNCKITANPEIVQYIAEHSPKLQEVLSGYIPGANAGGKVDIKDVSYKDLVSTDNWKKNAD